MRSSELAGGGWACFLTAMAAGLGWGIRGQYGHETGAMIAGALASLTLVMLLVPVAKSLDAMRAAAMMTVAIGIGGSMTYGQTVGLTHDGALVGNWAALRWGMLGLFIKGGIWIGYAGLFLGMGLGGRRYSAQEIALLMVGALGGMFLGIWLLNSPYDPAHKILPPIYFSDSWYFEPNADLKPRREVWGGLLVSLVGLASYARWVRQDRLAGRMALVGFLAGGLGFPGGQSIQAYHAWNAAEMAQSTWANYFQYFNWWNMMETTFGLIFGAILAGGLYCHRHLIDIDHPPREGQLSPSWEFGLCLLHVGLMITAEFVKLSGAAAIIGVYTEWGLLLAAIPLIGVVAGRYWPYLLIFPVVAAPIAGKTLRQLCFESDAMPVSRGWILLVGVPLAVMIGSAFWLARDAARESARRAAAKGVLLSVWLYFGWNTAFFEFAWPWRPWTGRTPNQIIFSVCALSLTAAAIVLLSIRPPAERHRKTSPSNDPID